MIGIFKKNQNKRFWRTAVVKRGRGEGSRIAYPTINLDAHILGIKLPRGVYASLIKVAGKEYVGALYYGPRKIVGEKFDVLEIHVLGFNDNIYGKKIKFTLGKFIRGVEGFSSVEKLKKRISIDIKEIIEFWK